MILEADARLGCSVVGLSNHHAANLVTKPGHLRTIVANAQFDEHISQAEYARHYLPPVGNAVTLNLQRMKGETIVQHLVQGFHTDAHGGFEAIEVKAWFSFDYLDKLRKVDASEQTAATSGKWFLSAGVHPSELKVIIAT